MGLRQTLNEKPLVTVGVVVAIAALALWFGFSAIFGGKRIYYGSSAYFTDDDGKSYFADRIDRVVPYTKNGKEVVRAHVYRCPSKGTFVGFLQRYTPETASAMKESLEAAAAGRQPKNPGLVVMADQVGSEYKKPGAGNPWKKASSGDAVVGNIMELCDNKPGERAQLVIP